MPFCHKCGSEVKDTDSICSTCGADLSDKQMDNNIVSGSPSVQPDELDLNVRRSWEITQSRGAIWAALGILLFVDILTVVLWALEGVDRPNLVIGSIVIDVFLGIFLLLGKNWARVWMLVRIVLGLLVWGGVYIFQGDYGGLLLNTGVLVALLILLTGNSTQFRIVGSIILAAVAFIGGIVIVAFQEVVSPSVDLPSEPATYTIPASFSTYTSEGFFSISYPSDWSAEMSFIEEMEELTEQFLDDVGMGSSIEESQIVFFGGIFTDEYDYQSVCVAVEPKSIWPLESVVESNHQWYTENVERYSELSRIRTKIDGKSAIIQTYKGNDVDSYFVGCTTAFIKSDKFMWSVVCVCDGDKLDKNLDTFENVVRSLRVEY